jgi:vancomycin permeability regulator SanA
MKFPIRRTSSKILITFISLGAVGIALLKWSSIIRSQIHSTEGMIYTIEKAPSKPIAIVLGAGLRRDGTPTHVLQDRITTAVALYQQGKVMKLLMSGDNSVEHYNEPEAMRRFAVQLGVPEDDIVLDYAGFRTYDTCFRAKHIFNVDDAIIVTQRFHLPRALYLCRELGINAIGVEATGHQYSKRLRTFWDIREKIATLVAVWEINVNRPKPILG